MNKILSAMKFAEEESNIHYRAMECIKLCESAGGITCHFEGIKRVIEAMQLAIVAAENQAEEPG